MTWITEIGATLVGLGGLLFGWTQSTRTLGQQRTLADLAATRDVLEAGAIHLHHVAYALDPVQVDLITNAKTTRETLAKLGKDYDELSERMKVRLHPDHETTREFVSASQEALDAWRAVDRTVALHLRHLAGEGASQAHGALERERLNLVATRLRFDEHRRLFIDAAARTAGARLPSEP
jgi:hypothetical protein